VVIGAQYTSGSPNKRATSREATVPTAVRAECTRTGHTFDRNRFFSISSYRHGDSRDEH
jgi:hypothetical protein